MNPFETVTKAQARVLRSAAWQILIVTFALIGFALFQTRPLGWILLAAALGLVALPPLLLKGPTRQLSVGFVYPLAVLALGVPWWLGGVRHPLVLLPIVALHTAAFLLGVRQALWLSIAALANLAALIVGENLGLIQGSTPDPETLVLFITGMILHGLSFISTPLNLVRQLLSSAEHDLSARQANEIALIELTDTLESNVERRTNELILKRHLLQQSVDDVADSMATSIASLQDAARELAATFPNDGGEPQWVASRIVSKCERMEAMHTALHRFCKLGEASLKLQVLPTRTHTEMVHRIWNEVASLHPERTISFFLDSIPECVCDPDLLRQVWQNLFFKALESTLSTANPAVHVFCSEREFCVEDNGTGFDESQAGTLFGLFQRPSDPDGFAEEEIGLAVSKRIIEMHGGTIRAEGIPNKGEIFRFFLRADLPSDSSS